MKNVTTAEGGAICLNCLLPLTMRNFIGAPYDESELPDKDAFSKSKAGGWRYDIVGLGMKINMADECGYRTGSDTRVSCSSKERRRVFNTYSKGFADYGLGYFLLR